MEAVQLDDGASRSAANNNNEATVLRSKSVQAEAAEYQRYDGWYNNLAHPHWGSVGTYYTMHMTDHYSLTIR